MSLDDWKYDHGWRGTAYELVMLGWRLVAIGISLAIFGLILWGWFLLARGVFS